MFLGVKPGFSTPGLITTTFESAELSKLAANAMLAARVSFMNEIGTLAEKIGADIREVESILGSDPRIGPDHIHAGIGWGGYCLPKDVQMLITLQHDYGLKSEVVAATQAVNSQQPKLFVESIKRRYGVSAENASSHKLTLAVWGCAFKPATDDIRDSSAVNVIRQLLDCGFDINLYDPVAKFPDSSDQLEQYSSIIDTLDNVDGIVVLTDWKSIKDFYAKLAWPLVKQKIVFDGRGCLQASAWEELGFEFYGLGRKPVK
jgi:UDPglucose 6-dehydrogenase